MQEIAFDCPKELSQKFWMACRAKKVSPGAALRTFMVNEIAASDPSFQYDLRTATGKDASDVASG